MAPAEGGEAFSARSVDVRQRTGAPASFQLRNFPDRNESIAVFTGGINVVIDDVVVGAGGDVQPVALGRIDIETDQIVMWSSNLQSLLSRRDGAPSLQSQDIPLELYMEGNIIFRQGDRVIYAKRMYYNVTQQYGMVLDAELLTDIPQYEGLLRLKADVLQQVNARQFEAYNASITSSRMGVPRYWFQSGNLTVRDDPRPATDDFGRILSNPVTGEVEVEHNYQATSRNNAVYVGGVPVLYWPTFATNLQQPSFYLERIKIKSDGVFGQQVLADWNLYHLLGVEEPLPGTEWTLSTDYLSDRGPALGTLFRYQRPGLFGLEGPTRGLIDLWGIKDSGLDDLGADRRAVTPEEEWRGRALWQHRTETPLGFELTGEVGWLSDRNFLEQYFEQDWDTQKDLTTGFELKQYRDSASLGVWAEFQLNDFFMQTEWLPRLDHYLIGKPLLGGRVTWHEHSHVGYARLNPATAPLNAGELAKFDPLFGEMAVEGVRAATRHELSVPFNVGPAHVAPYVSGEAAYYGEDLTGGSLTRLLGQGGVRSSIAMWNTRPEVQNDVFNLNGLSHKIVFESELLFAETSDDMPTIPRYDALDDDAQEFFRRRFFFDTFGGVAGMDVAPRFSDRNFALRSGMQSYVTAAATDVADDLMTARFSVRQRLQTKRGVAGQERIIDWMTLDIDSAVFPKADRDNFGSHFGMLDYVYHWHLGDRFSLLSDGYMDFFSNGLRTFSVGGVINRPDRGRLYLAYRSIEGPFSSNLLSASADYRLSRKWILHAGASVDFGQTGNIGQSLAVTRIGESALLRMGMTFDESRDNVGFQLRIEPRFMPRNRIRRAAGIDLPPLGSMGIE